MNIKFQEIEGKVAIMLFNVTEARIKVFGEHTLPICNPNQKRGNEGKRYGGELE